jgi:hypothetical protein
MQALRHMRTAIKDQALRRTPTPRDTLGCKRVLVSWVDRKLRGMVWVTEGCKSWYMNKMGRNASIWPSYAFVYRHRTLRIRAGNYEFHACATVAKG